MNAGLKGAIAGGVGTVVLLAAGTAVAGSGVGGVFNLGQTNTVNKTSVLTGTTDAAMLRVTNTNTGASATGLNITVASGRPPFLVNSSTRVANLNADLLDGLDASAFQRKGNLAFQNLALTNGWTGNCFGTGAAGIAVSGDGVVHLRGGICSGTSLIAFVLPAPFRPSVNLYLPVDTCNATTGRLEINASSGNVAVVNDPQVADSATCFTSLAGVSYTLPY